jgi:ankyrin repeat protein
MTLLLENKADPLAIANDKDGQTVTALMKRIQHWGTQGMRLLLEHKCDVNAVAKDGSTPLTLSLDRNDNRVKILKLLLEFNADVHAVDDALARLVATRALRIRTAATRGQGPPSRPPARVQSRCRRGTGG